MRTTLTLDDDVAILLKRLSHERQLSFRTLLNKARAFPVASMPPHSRKLATTWALTHMKDT